MSEPYPPAQIKSLLGLLNWLCSYLPGLHWIAGHEALDTKQVPASNDATVMVPRKADPGPLFPWEWVTSSAPLQPFPPS